MSTGSWTYAYGTVGSCAWDAKSTAELPDRFLYFQRYLFNLPVFCEPQRAAHLHSNRSGFGPGVMYLINSIHSI